jgi:glycosyltransferase involved in cell wall biosynthesis
MPKHLRVLVDARPLVDPHSGGVGRVARQVISFLLNSTTEIDWYLVTTGLKKPTLDSAISEHSAVHHIHLPWPNKLWSASAMLGAVSLDREAAKSLLSEEDRPKRFDKAIILNLGFTGFLETPYALLLHDLSFMINPEWFTLKARYWHIAVNPKELIRRANRLFSVSETTARDAARLFGTPVKEIGVVKPGIKWDTGYGIRDSENEASIGNSESSSPYSLHSTPYALILGGGNPRKNVPTAIKAFEILKRDPAFANLHLVIVGEKKGRERNSHVLRPTSYVPFPSDIELDVLYQNASLFLYPSWYEGYGLPLHEAARYRIPCIASTDGALPETAPEGTLFVPPSKPHLWAEALRTVLLLPDAYKTRLDEELVRENFTPFIQWLER